MRSKFWVAYLFGAGLILAGDHVASENAPIVLSDTEMQEISSSLLYYISAGEHACNQSGYTGVDYYSNLHSRKECDWTGSSSDACVQLDNGFFCLNLKYSSAPCQGEVVNETNHTGYFNRN